jgi:hypothetical protein
MKHARPRCAAVVRQVKFCEEWACGEAMAVHAIWRCPVAQLKISSSIPGLAARSYVFEPAYPLVGACMNPRLRVLASKLERFGKIVNRLVLLTPNHEPKVAPN